MVDTGNLTFFRTWALLWQRQQLYRVYVLLLLGCFIKQLIFPASLVDASEYLHAASNLSNGFWPSSCLQNTDCDHWLSETRRTFGYPVLILVLGLIQPFILFVQYAVAAVIPVLSAMVLHHLNPSGNAVKWHLLFYIFYPVQFFYPGYTMPEVWVQAWVVIVILAVVKKWYQWVGFGLSILILLKPVFIIFIPITTILFVLKYKKTGLILPLLVFIGICAINKEKTSVFHYSGIAVENQWEYNHRAVINKVMTAKEKNAYLKKVDADLAGLNFKGRYNYMKQAANVQILRHWKLYAYLHFKGILAAMADPGRYDFVAFSGITDQGGNMGIKTSQRGFLNQPKGLMMYMVFFIAVNVLKWGLACIYFFKNFRKFWWLGLAVVLILAATGPVGSIRYLYPVMPLVIAFAAAGLSNLIASGEKDISPQR